MKSLSTAIALLAVGLALPADAAPKRTPARKAVAKPKPAPTPAAVPEEPRNFMVPKAVVLRNPTPAEAQANAVWNIRAALNVAALQCQYTRWGNTVKNYNDFLRHHSDELSAAQQTMIGHFRRTAKAGANTAFDQYTTRTYNSYSTLDAQYSFCLVAGELGRNALALRRGQLGPSALTWLPEIREALAHRHLARILEQMRMEPVAIDMAALTDPAA